MPIYPKNRFRQKIAPKRARDGGEVPEENIALMVKRYIWKKPANSPGGAEMRS